MRTKLPLSVTKLFWGDNLQDLSWEKHQDYITKTIMDKGNLNSLTWLLKRADKTYLSRLVKNKKFNPKSKNFWNIYLS